MKKRISAAVIAAALMLSACSNGNSSSVSENSVTSQAAQSSETPEVSDITDSSDTSDNSQSAPESFEDNSETSSETESDVSSVPDESGEEFILYGPGEDVVKQSEFSRIIPADESEEEISAQNWLQASVYGFTYMAEPGGDYKRVKTGDEILGFKVGEAECTFANDPDSGRTGSEAYFSSGYAELEGSTELNGELYTATEDGFSYEAGQLLFVPDANSSALPVMNYSYSTDGGVFIKVNENGSPYSDFLVSAADGIDVSGIPTDGTHVRAKVTLSGISLSSIVDVVTNIRAQIDVLELG